MKLQAPQRTVAVANPHQHPVLRPGGGLQRGRQRAAYAQRVIADGGETLRDPVEQVPAVVADGGQVTVARGGRGPDLGRLLQADALVAEAHPEHGNLGLGQYPPGEAEIATVGRVTGTGRDDDVVELAQVEVGALRVVVAQHGRLGALYLGDQLEQVVGVRVEVVHQQGSHPISLLRYDDRSSWCGGRRERDGAEGSSRRRRRTRGWVGSGARAGRAAGRRPVDGVVNRLAGRLTVRFSGRLTVRVSGRLTVRFSSRYSGWCSLRYSSWYSGWYSAWYSGWYSAWYSGWCSAWYSGWYSGRFSGSYSGR